MRLYGLLSALPIVLLATSPALAKMHDTSPPTVMGFLKIVVWIAILSWFFRRYMRADSGPAWLLSIAAVSATLVAGIYVEALVKVLAGIPPEKHLSWLGQVICLSCVNLVLLTAVTAMGAPRLFNQSFGALGLQKRVVFWIIALLPALYHVFYHPPRA